MRDLLISRLGPFRHKNFRNFFLVQSISMIGTTAHDLARAWIVINLMGSAGALGSLLLASAIPSSLLILHGGVWVDRLNVRKIMMATKAVLTFSALLIFLLVEKGKLEFWHLLVFALLEGAVLAFDSPAFQALTVRLVPRGDFQQALALNSTNFHVARMLGPVVAGVLMAWHGPGLVFLFDGLSYLAVIALLRGMRLPEPALKAANPVKSSRAMKEGFRYILNNPSMRYRVLQLGLAIGLMSPLMAVVFKAFIQSHFKLSADQFGFVFSVPAAGAVIGALSFAFVKPKRPLSALKFGIPSAILLTLLLPFTTELPVATGLMGLIGLAMYLSFSGLTVSLHLDVDEAYRGRLGSVIGFCFLSVGPLMCFPIGVYADTVGFSIAIVSVALLYAGLSGWLYHKHREALRPALATSQIEPIQVKSTYERDIRVLRSHTQPPSHEIRGDAKDL